MKLLTPAESRDKAWELLLIKGTGEEMTTRTLLFSPDINCDQLQSHVIFAWQWLRLELSSSAVTNYEEKIGTAIREAYKEYIRMTSIT